MAGLLAAEPSQAEPSQAEPRTNEVEAEDPSTCCREQGEPAITRTRRSLAIAAAVFPGVIVRGSGSYLVHEKRAAKRLLIMADIGLGSIVVGGLAVGLTGGSKYFIEPFVPMIVAGSGLFVASWMSDLWVAAGGSRTRPEPRAATPWSVELGTTYLRDAYRERAFLRPAARYVQGRVEVGAVGWFDLLGHANEGLIEAKLRVIGPAATGEIVEDNSFFVVRVGGRARSDDEDRVDVLTAELELIGRLDMIRLDRALRGTFVELSTGIGVERGSYPNDTSDADSLLLGRAVWGVYLRDRGEATMFYDHRRDHLAGGLAAWRAAGFVGSIGANADVRIGGPWAVRAEVEVGNAWVVTAALRYQGGAR